MGGIKRNMVLTNFPKIQFWKRSVMIGFFNIEKINTFTLVQ